MTASTQALPGPHEHAPVPLHGQSVTKLHPHTPPLRHAVPVAFDVQSVHVPPAEPHDVCAVSVAQNPVVPPSAKSQHAPLQPWLPSHALPHTPPMHASPDAQSACELQPQALATQALSSDCPAQLLHEPPAEPHDVACVSVAQKPVVPPSAKSQHAPLHGCVVVSHAEVHVPGVPVTPLHAPDVPLGHSVSDVQPHEPPLVP
jgi:hypothetical protein